ncbi:transposase family protein [Streptomyces sp. NPDC085463]|uniref:transposase family protein n=1 Tax=Streptomyces sp. NPDC085463 TaxID=3365724 RepID=UPI0037D733BF
MAQATPGKTGVQAAEAAVGAGARHQWVFLDRLLATLVHLHHGATHDVLACSFGVEPLGREGVLGVHEEVVVARTGRRASCRRRARKCAHTSATARPDTTPGRACPAPRR